MDVGTLNQEVTGRGIVESLGGRWRGDRGRCRCPAHPDRSPSLDVREAGDRVLVVCRSHCPQEAVIEALRDLGLWSAPSPRAQARHRLGAILRSLRHEASIIVVGINDLLAYRPIEAVDLARVETALRRLEAEQRELGTYRRRGRHSSILEAVDQEVAVVRAAGLRLVSRDAPFTDDAFSRTCDAAGRITAASEVRHE